MPTAIRQRQARIRAAPRCARLRPSCAQPRAEPLEREIRGHGARDEQRHALIRRGHRGGRLERFVRRVDEQEHEKSDRQREQHVDSGLSQAAREREPEQAEGHRDDTDVEPDQRERPQISPIRLRRSHGDRNLVLEGRPGRRHDLDEMRFADDPRVRDDESRLPEMRQHRAFIRRIRRERPVRIVHRHLRDRDRVGPVVEDMQDDPVARQHRALDCQAFDRRRAIPTQTVGRSGPDD